jgi:hypothetical protein
MSRGSAAYARRWADLSWREAMPSEFEVVVDARRLDGGEHGTVTGPLALRLDGLWFPERNWRDFPVIVLGWWLRECASLAPGQDREFLFMDGPFRFRVSWPTGLPEIAFEDLHGDAPSVVATGGVPLPGIVAAVSDAAKDVVAACERRGWAGRDLEQLRASLT